MAEAASPRSLRCIITVTAPIPPLPTQSISEQRTLTTKSSTFYSSSTEIQSCMASSSSVTSLGTYIVATVMSVFAVVMFASLMACLRRRWKMNRRRLGHED
ncbi:hypothetical protein CC77DRAFT_744447 [Alternaria alternata]|uniref:Uncharacterized protein n=1 Tax=Alternaria alternata TaxID=5599 RepID=A0A177DSF2_ALTAL|nr:hypothetical protein CC77DRAFT_744447 [Alternaria alternata]OAG22713.1 hypothetical protein CC77DRAFT_744447 [Alternaria alternata]